MSRFSLSSLEADSGLQSPQNRRLTESRVSVTSDRPTRFSISSDTSSTGMIRPSRSSISSDPDHHRSSRYSVSSDPDINRSARFSISSDSGSSGTNRSSRFSTSSSASGYSCDSETSSRRTSRVTFAAKLETGPTRRDSSQSLPLQPVLVKSRKTSEESNASRRVSFVDETTGKSARPGLKDCFKIVYNLAHTFFCVIFNIC